jgi:hypothetical protein
MKSMMLNFEFEGILKGIKETRRNGKKTANHICNCAAFFKVISAQIKIVKFQKKKGIT